MTYRTLLEIESCSLNWCQPQTITTESGDVVTIAINESELCGCTVNGSSVSMDWSTLARLVNPDYDDYSGWDDRHIALDVDWEILTCNDCPFRDDCDAMDEEVENTPDFSTLRKITVSDPIFTSGIDATQILYVGIDELYGGWLLQTCGDPDTYSTASTEVIEAVERVIREYPEMMRDCNPEDEAYVYRWLSAWGLC